MNIPIYRAKKIDSDKVILYDTDELSVGRCNELLQDGWIDTKQDKYFRKNKNDEWIEGYLVPTDADCTTNDGFSIENSEDHHKVDQNTLAIHFPNMIDKNGKKIFASLSEDGVGGDNVKVNGSINLFTLHYCTETSSISVTEYGTNIRLLEYECFEVIGIHKGENNE